MSAIVICAVLWVLAATATAFLPMRRQYAPGIVLLVLAPVLIGWIGIVHGWLLGGFALFAFVSMFRRPLQFLLARLRGQNPQVPQ